MTQRPVIVTGMHRSGTSAVARVVNLLGVDLGPEEDLMEAKPDNPEGFWENRHIVQIDDDLLAVLGGRWDEPPLTYGWERQAGIDDLQARAEKALERIEGERPGFKDPRAALLLGFWKRIWPDAQVVTVVRHPVAVARSLEHRNGFDPEKSAALWLRYTAEALAGVDSPTVVAYEDLLSEPEKVVTQLASELGLKPSFEAVTEAVASIRTGRPPASELPNGDVGPMMSAALELHRLLPNSSRFVAAMVAQGLQGGIALERLLATEARLGEVVDMADRFHEELKKAQRDFAAARAEADRLQGEAAHRMEALRREERARELLVSKMAEIEQELAWRRRIQARLERIVGRRILVFLSGHRELLKEENRS